MEKELVKDTEKENWLETKKIEQVVLDIKKVLQLHWG